MNHSSRPGEGECSRTGWHGRIWGGRRRGKMSLSGWVVVIAASILGHEWGSSSSTDESSPVGNKSDFSDVFDCKNLREGIKFEDRCCIMHSPLKQVMECLISIQPPSCEGSSPASCIMHPTTLPPNRLQHTQTDNGRLILSPLWCHEYWFEKHRANVTRGGATSALMIMKFF